jgi:hypothetical protein
MRLLRTRRRKVFAIAIAAAVLAIGAAVAAWIVTSSGQSGRAQVGTAPLAPTITPAANPPAGDLFPGGTGAVYVDASNPNTYEMTLTTATVNPATATNILVHKPLGTPNAACPSSNFTFNTVGALSVSVPAGSSTNLAIPGAVSMSASAPIECAGSFVWLAAADAVTYTFAK